MSAAAWGDPIAVDGVRPAWLRGRVLCDLKTKSGWTNKFQTEAPETIAEDWSWKHGNGDTCVTHIRLPASHSAYLAIAKGYEPWAGGDKAPGDFCSRVLFRNGVVSDFDGAGPWYWTHSGDFADIIGYRKRLTPATDDGDYVRVKRMTETDARMFAKPFHNTYGHDIVRMFIEMGIVPKPLTRAEKIATTTGIPIAYVEWVLAALKEDGE